MMSMITSTSPRFSSIKVMSLTPKREFNADKSTRTDSATLKVKLDGPDVGKFVRLVSPGSLPVREIELIMSLAGSGTDYAQEQEAKLMLREFNQSQATLELTQEGFTSGRLPQATQLFQDVHAIVNHPSLSQPIFQSVSTVFTRAQETLKFIQETLKASTERGESQKVDPAKLTAAAQTFPTWVNATA